MTRPLCAALALLLVAAGSAAAQTAVTLGLTATMAVFPAQVRAKLSVCDQSTTASIAVAFGATTPALNTAGSYTVGPGQCIDWPAGDIPPQEQVNAIASAGSTPVTMDQR